MRPVFIEMIEVQSAKVSDRNRLILQLEFIGPPFESGLLEILNDQTLMKFKRRDRISKLLDAALGIEEIQKCKADPITGVEYFARKWIVNIQLPVRLI